MSEDGKLSILLLKGLKIHIKQSGVEVARKIIIYFGLDFVLGVIDNLVLGGVVNFVKNPELLVL